MGRQVLKYPPALHHLGNAPLDDVGWFHWSIRSPSNSTAPAVTSPRCGRIIPEIVLSVVLFPAPFDPKSATICPVGTSKRDPAQHQDSTIIDDFDVV